MQKGLEERVEEGGLNWLVTVFSGGARGAQSMGGASVALGPKRARASENTAANQFSR